MALRFSIPSLNNNRYGSQPQEQQNSQGDWWQGIGNAVSNWYQNNQDPYHLDTPQGQNYAQQQYNQYQLENKTPLGWVKNQLLPPEQEFTPMPNGGYGYISQGSGILDYINPIGKLPQYGRIIQSSIPKVQKAVEVGKEALMTYGLGKGSAITQAATPLQNAMKTSRLTAIAQGTIPRQPVAQRANIASLRRAGATLSTNPIPVRQIAVQADIPAHAVVPQYASKVRKAVAQSENAQRQMHINELAAKGNNPYVKPPARTATQEASKSGITAGNWFEKMITDADVAMNKLGKDIETSKSLYKAAGWKGVQLAQDTASKVKTALNGVSIDRLDDYLTLQHNISKFEMNPGRKGKVLYKRPDGVSVALDKMGLEIELQKLKTALGADISKVGAAAEVVTSHYNDLLRRWATSGGIKQEVVDLLTEKYPFYNPTDYIDNIMEAGYASSDNAVQFVKRLGSDAAIQESKRPLELLVLETVKREKAIQQNTILKMIANAVTAKQSAYDDLRKSGVIFEKLKYWDNGAEKTIEVPKDLAQTVELFFNPKEPDLVSKTAAAIQDVARAGMTRYNPAFYVPNLMIDTFTALMTQHINPVTTLKYLGKNLGNIGRNEVLAQMKRTGAAGGNISARTIEQEIAKGNIFLDSRKGWKKIVDVLDAVNESFEYAPRMAAYETAVKRGATADEAALMARRITIDFARGGAATKALNPYFLFLNAAFQGSMIIPRGALGNPKRFAVSTAGFTTALAGLYAYNSQYPEYYKVDEYIRKGSLVLMLPSDERDENGEIKPHYLTIIPALREFSIFQSAAVQIGDIIKNEDPQDFGQFITQTLALVSPMANFIEVGSAGTPYMSMPLQPASTLMEIGNNYDPYRQKQIVSDYMKEESGGDKTKEYSQYTSIFARRLGELSKYLPEGWQISPQLADYFIKNTTGGAGQGVMAAYDAVDNFVSGIKNYDTNTVQLAIQLKNIQYNEDPQYVKVERQKFLNKLDTETRKRVLEAETSMDSKVPYILNRFYRDYGTRQETIASAKAKEAEKASPAPNEQFITDVTNLVKLAKTGKVTHAQFDKELSNLRAYKSGASAQKYSGKLYTSDVNKYKAGGLTEPEAALDDYFTMLDEETAKYGGYPSSDEWNKINAKIDSYLRSNYSTRAIQYVKENKSAWMKDLPADVQTYLKQRDNMMAAGTWFDGYRGSSIQKTSQQKAAEAYFKAVQKQKISIK